MKTPRRIDCINNPGIILDLGNGNWYYNYDIQSETVKVLEGEELVDQTRYTYIQVKMSGKPDYNRCVEAIIRQYISQSEEFDLINSANKALLSGNQEGKEIVEYKKYLDLLEEIKSKIKNDFKCQL